MADLTVEKENLIGEIDMAKVYEIRIPNEDSRRDPFEKDVKMEFTVEKILEDDKVKGTLFENTVLLNKPAKGQKIRIVDLLRFYVDGDSDKDYMKWKDKDGKEHDMLPYRKGVTVKQYLIDKKLPLPIGVTFKNGKNGDVLQGSSMDYFTFGKEELKTAKENAYKGHGISTEEEHFPLLVPKSRRKDLVTMDHENWRIATVTLVELHFAE